MANDLSISEYIELLTRRYMPIATEGLVYAHLSDEGYYSLDNEVACKSFAGIHTPKPYSDSGAFSVWKKRQSERYCEGIVFKPHAANDEGETFEVGGKLFRTHEVDHGFHVYNKLTTNADGEQKVTRYFNTFSGLKKASKRGNCNKILSLIREGLCCGNEKAFNKFIGFFAHAVQRPGERVPLIPVLFGDQGCGKGTVIEYLCEAAFEDAYVTSLRSKDLSGDFNGSLEHKLILIASEAAFSGNFDVINEIKRITGDKRIEINRKGIDQFMTDNYGRFIIATNRSWAAPIEEGNRRFILFPCRQLFPLESKEHKDYFQAILDEKASGGLAALNYYLKTFDLSNYDAYTSEDFFPEFTRSMQFTTLLKTDLIGAYFMECDDDRAGKEFDILHDERLAKNQLPSDVAYSVFVRWAESQKLPSKHTVPNRREFEQAMRKKGYESKRVLGTWGTTGEMMLCSVHQFAPAPSVKDKTWLQNQGFQFKGSKQEGGMQRQESTSA